MYNLKWKVHEGITVLTESSKTEAVKTAVF